MKYRLCILLFLYTPKYSPEPLKTIDLPVVEIVHTKTLKEYCLDISTRLDKLGYLSVSPEKFSQFILIVSYCESGHKPSISGKDGAGSHGLWQMTTATRNKLRLKKRNSIKDQSENYFKFLKTVGVKLKQVKSSADLHCINFAPGRPVNGILSKVTNPHLDALDFNRDSVITKQDFVLFQNKKLKV